MDHRIRWTPKKIRQRIELITPLVYRQRAPLPPFRYSAMPAPEADPIIAPEYDDSGWQQITPPCYWGDWNADFMLRGSFRVPAEWAADVPVALYMPLGDSGDFSHPEALTYIDGTPYAACDRNHQELLLDARYCDGQPHALALHGWFGLGQEEGQQLFARPCFVVQIDQPTRDFVAQARMACEVVHLLEPQDVAYTHLLNALDDAFRLLDLREPFGDAFYASVPAAHETLRRGIAQAGPPLDVQITATGHAHIDVAWLWTLGQTRRKAGRTFHTVLRLMEQFPDYHFTQSQPQLYDYVKRDYPELFAAIKERIAEGRWGITGDMWIEADCNLSGPESLARQFLLGRAFFRREFGDAGSPVLWLPDVFGYTWALPQLIREAGLEYFFTIKLSWNQYNRMPFDSFWWQGIDGTRVLTHLSPTAESTGGGYSTYNSRANAYEVLATWRNFQQKTLLGKAGDATPPLLLAFGYGDGGGGPTRDMLENLRELQSFPSMPQVKQQSVGAFFRELEQTAGERLPTWNGELYFEFHRGTYTTQSRNKRANRKSEYALHDAELLATMAGTLDASYQYPTDTFTAAWQLICLNQFHDIIPGTSIHPVYVESQQQYAEIARLAEDARTGALAAIAAHTPGDVLIINPTGFARADLAFYAGTLPAGTLHTGNGRAVHVQPTAGGSYLDAGDIASYSVVALSTGESAATLPDTGLRVTERSLENNWLLVEWNDAGDFTRIYDRHAGREVLPSGELANQWQAFSDRPMNWDAWDVDSYYDDQMWLADPASSITISEEGPLRASVTIKRRILNSEYTQQIALAHNSPRLDITTEIDWRERHIFLKAAFPVDVLAPTATYEIQWGNLERPTHRNTSWDWARFETCAQKWVDLSEGDYGVSLLNDCKYGHDIRDGVMRISLLRASTYPDPEADQGQHRFTYSLLPHSGPVGTATMAAAYALNDPLIVAAASGATQAGPRWDTARSLFRATRPAVIIETVKRAEDGRGAIVRMYESQRTRGALRLECGAAVAAAWRTNLLEEDQQPLEVEGSSVLLSARPYEIITVRVVFADGDHS